MLDHWPISRRINCGYMILTLMLVGFALFSHRSVTTLSNGYAELSDTAAQTISISAFVEDVFEARIASYDYRSNPGPDLLREVTGNLDEVINGTDLIAAFAVDPARLNEVEQLVDMASQFRVQFLDMTTRLDVANGHRASFNARTDEIGAAVNDIFTLAVQNGNPSVATAAGRTLQSSMSAVVQSKRFISSADPANLAQFHDHFASFERALAQLAALNPPGQISTRIAELQSLMVGYTDMLDAYAETSQTVAQLQHDVISPLGYELQEGLDAVAVEVAEEQDAFAAAGTVVVSQLKALIPIVGIIATLVAIAAATFIGHWITRSVMRLADTTDRLAAGDNEIDIDGTQHKHELGRMARALNVFREAQVERQEASAERAKLRAQQDAVVQTMKHELAQLAEGDLTIHIRQEFAPDYEELRENFNAAVTALHEAITKVTESSSMIRTTASDTNSATEDLSQRTENQAATLEQTAAALDQLTASVRSAADHAKSVDQSVNIARSEATKNGEIVAQAVTAMGEIEESSKQIKQVISLIDDIAFQTNLLALNAGVEAARAGESGRGFAVVASEVRALAQRSADAAKEISALIANSSRHVAQGTQLVGNAGDALSKIITQVNDIASMTSQIAVSAEEQSIGLSEINIGVNQLDKVTQQNAAMVQQSMTRGEALSRESGKLGTLIGQFRTNAITARAAPITDAEDPLSQAIANTQPTHDPINHQVRAQAAKPTSGNTAEAIWEHF